MNMANTSSVTLTRPWIIPAGNWLLYTFAAVYPFFVFSIFLSRDSAPLWVVVGTVLFVLIQFLYSGGYFWLDKSHVFLLLMMLVYLWATYLVFAQESGESWLGRTPFDRAVTTDLRLVYVILAFFAFTNLLADANEEVFSRILRIQVYVGAAIALFGLVQYVLAVIFGSNVLVGIETTNESFVLRGNIFRLGREKIFRASAFFNEPSYFGFFLVPLTVKMIAAWSSGFMIRSRTVDMCLIGIFVCAILANFSLTAILSISVVMLVFVFTRSGSPARNVRYVLLVAVIVAAGMLVLPFGGAVVERVGRIFQFRDASTIDRLFRAYTGALVFVENLWIGVGPGGYAFWYPRMGGVDTLVMASPLNVWLTFLTDVGLLGSIPFFGFLWSVLRRSFKKIPEHPLIGVYFWSVCSLLVLLTILDLWYGELFWFECAMLVALSCGIGLKDREKRLSNRPGNLNN